MIYTKEAQKDQVSNVRQKQIKNCQSKNC